MIYKYLEFKENSDGTWAIWSKKKGYFLGLINFYEKWKRWIFCPENDTYFSEDCLKSIMEKIKELDKK